MSSSSGSITVWSTELAAPLAKLVTVAHRRLTGDVLASETAPSAS